MDQAQLEILIKIIADQTGATLTLEQIEAVKQKMTAMGADGEQAFQKLGDGSERFSFRTQHHAQMAILAMAGLQGPFTNLLYHMEYIQQMATNMGVSVTDMLTKFAPMIGVVAILGAVAKGFSEVGKIGKEALDEVGEADRGLFGDIEAGLNVLELLNTKLEKTDDVAKRMAEHFSLVNKNLRDSIESAGHFDQISQLEDARKKIEETQARGVENYRKLGDEIESRKKNATGLNQFGPEFGEEFRKANATPAGQAANELSVKDTGHTDMRAVIAAYYDDLIRQNELGLERFNAAQETLLKENAGKIKTLVVEKATGKAYDDLQKEQTDLRVKSQEADEAFHRADLEKKLKQNEAVIRDPKSTPANVALAENYKTRIQIMLANSDQERDLIEAEAREKLKAAQERHAEAQHEVERVSREKQSTTAPGGIGARPQHEVTTRRRERGGGESVSTHPEAERIEREKKTPTVKTPDAEAIAIAVTKLADATRDLANAQAAVAGIPAARAPIPPNANHLDQSAEAYDARRKQESKQYSDNVGASQNRLAAAHQAFLDSETRNAGLMKINDDLLRSQDALYKSLYGTFSALTRQTDDLSQRIANMRLPGG